MSQQTEPIFTSVEQLCRIADFLTNLELNLERARVLTTDLTDSYFSIPKSNPRRDFSVLYEYDRAGIRADIASDYLYQMQLQIDEAKQLFSREWASLKDEATPVTSQTA